ncbi:MAG: PilZ domain-containing protein [Phycisphaerales bacterium]|nr:MAG: PilZ domain-containing protein [Phycisphaerales bacterium]
MDATEISPLTEEAIAKLLDDRNVRTPSKPYDNGRRQTPRWPFPGTVELWVPGEDGVEEHQLATCLNLSLGGVGMLADIELPVGLELALAIHQPEMSFHGRGAIRHCTAVEPSFYIGLEFLFDEE